MKHVLAPSERERGLQKALSPEGRARRIESLRRSTAEIHAYAVALHEYGMVDGAIAKQIGVTEETVARWLVGRRVRPKYGRGVIEIKEKKEK